MSDFINRGTNYKRFAGNEYLKIYYIRIFLINLTTECIKCDYIENTVTAYYQEQVV